MQIVNTLTIAYYLALVSLLPGVVTAVLSYAFRGTLGDMLKDLWKAFLLFVNAINIFPREWGDWWGVGVVIFFFLSAIGFVLFLLVAGISPRYRPYGAATVLVVALISFFTILRYAGFMATPLDPMATLATIVSAVASAFVLWKSLGA